MKLYNNIEIKEQIEKDYISELTRDELPAPYLKTPPEIINISVGRQLFVDDFLIEKTNLNRVEHRPTQNPNNPIFKAEYPWETGKPEREWEESRPPSAALFSGGVWYDGEKNIYRMWYSASFHGSVAYAESSDGIHFTRVETGIYENSNLVLPRGGNFIDTNAVVMNRYPENPMKDKFIMSAYVRPTRVERIGCNIYTSEDGIHWTLQAHSAGVDDTTTVFYNPFRKKWVYSIKKSSKSAGRSREFSECDTLPQGRNLEDRVFWLRADEKDLVHPRWKVNPELYAFNSVAYESIMLGAFEIFKGPQNEISMQRGLPKVIELHIGYSRDGFHYSRQTDRSAFIKPSEEEGKWDCGYLHYCSSICTIEEDKLIFYYSGFSGDSSLLDPKLEERNGMYSNGSIGVAYLRRDGFASMNGNGELLTQKLEFDGKYLFVNANVKGMRVEIQDQNGKAFEGFELESSIPFSGDSCKQRFEWRNKKSLEDLAGKIIKLKITQEDGEFYAFWISKSEQGESGGYLAAGEKGKIKIKDE